MRRSLLAPATMAAALAASSGWFVVGCSTEPSVARDPDPSGTAGTGAAGEGGTGGNDGPIIRPEAGAAGESSSDPCAGDEPPPECNPPECGDGLVHAASGEVCDDANVEAGDGCSAECDAIEANYACPTPGAACVYLVECGDGRVNGDETCDDRNARSGDGCSDECLVEVGWRCPAVGARCVAAECGDGTVAGNEECDFPASTTGCSECRIDVGYDCDELGCEATVCGDGDVEHGEQCDDGNQSAGDGCSPFCKNEPLCPAPVAGDQPGDRTCSSSCGDGFVLPSDPSEECDDGNTADGDGCSSACQWELPLVTSGCPEGLTCTGTGYECRNALEVADPLVLPFVLRDFIGVNDQVDGQALEHPDFNDCNASAQGIVLPTLVDGRPKLADPVPRNSCTHGDEWFDRWYRDSEFAQTVVSTLELAEGTADSWGAGNFRYENSEFFPLDDIGWVGEGQELPRTNGHNFSFTSETRYWFEYDNTREPSLDFRGDDDVWVFVAGALVVDIGGVHGVRNGSFTLVADADGRGQAEYTDPGGSGTRELGLVHGQVYEIVVFQAERHVNASNYRLTLGGFSKVGTTCSPRCGNGIVTPDELCDDGENDGSYGGCIDCQLLGPHCGDGDINGPEECDDGVNLSTYDGCAPGCLKAPSCGDGQVDALFGELCDDGVNAGGYDKCAPGCVRGPRCGDGVRQKDDGEACDDGNTRNGDGCSSLCEFELVR